MAGVQTKGRGTDGWGAGWSQDNTRARRALPERVTSQQGLQQVREQASGTSGKEWSQQRGEHVQRSWFGGDAHVCLRGKRGGRVTIAEGRAQGDSHGVQGLEAGLWVSPSERGAFGGFCPRRGLACVPCCGRTGDQLGSVGLLLLLLALVFLPHVTINATTKPSHTGVRTHAALRPGPPARRLACSADSVQGDVCKWGALRAPTASGMAMVLGWGWGGRQFSVPALAAVSFQRSEPRGGPE